MNLTFLLILIGAFLFILILSSGYKTKYQCLECGNTWKGDKHHKGNTPKSAAKCKKCGSTSIQRMGKNTKAKKVFLNLFFVIVIAILLYLLIISGNV